MDDAYPARCADAEPGRNRNFDRPWTGDYVTGPDVPASPAHGLAWHDDGPHPSHHMPSAGQAARRAAEGHWREIAA